MPQLSTDLTLSAAQADTVVSRWLGDGVCCRAIEPLTGGMVNTALRLSLDGAPGSAVVKLSAEPDSDGLRQEQLRLDYLKAHTRLPVPTAYGYAPAGAALPYNCLLLETIPGVNMTQVDLSAADRDTIDIELAEVLIELHSHTRDTFGRVDEPGAARWGDIIVQQRDDGWHLSGLVDPSGAKFADVECELAYLQVFDTVGPAFFERYTAVHPLRPGYEVRRLFYWLETYMVHVWLFPDPVYRDRTAETAAAILIRLR